MSVSTENVDWQAVREGAATYSVANRLHRLLWRVTWLCLARWTPPPLMGWRRLLLRLFGARISSRAFVRGSVDIWMPAHLTMDDFASLGPGVVVYNVAPITIGAYAVVSQRAVLCTAGHDVDDPTFPLVHRPIVLAQDSWVAMEAFVGPGVTFGPRAVLGARAVAFGDLAADGIYVGNPCSLRRTRAS